MEDSVETQEDWLTTPDGHKLYTKTWKPDGPLKARLVFIHGFSDHCNWYNFFFSSLAKTGIQVYCYDQRGWGQSVHSPSEKGNMGPNTQVMTDITTFISNLPQAENHVPLFLMGHSMGGGEVLVYASTGPREIVSKIRGFLLESPLISLAGSAGPPKIQVMIGRLAAKVMPQYKMVSQLDAKTMTHDPELNQRWLDDPLCHDTATLEGLVGIMDRSAALDEGRIVLKEGLGEGGKTRIWCGHGTTDGACSFGATKRWFERIEVRDKELRVYEGWFHKLHAEPGQDRVTFAEEVGRWILDRAGPVEEVHGGSPRSKL